MSGFYTLKYLFNMGINTFLVNANKTLMVLIEMEFLREWIVIVGHPPKLLFCCMGNRSRCFITKLYDYMILSSYSHNGSANHAIIENCHVYFDYF